MRWYLAPFRQPVPTPNASTIDLFVMEEDEGQTPPLYSCFIAEDHLGRQPEPYLVNLLSVTLWALFSAVPGSVRDFLFLHAGSVVHDGQALLLPGGTGSGKSSLVVALLQAGFDYLSDEHGALDPVTGWAYPLPKPAGLEPDALGLLPGLDELLDHRELPPLLPSKGYVRPEDVGRAVAPRTPVRCVVFPTPAWDGPPRLERLTRAEAVEQMAANCFNLDRYRDRGVAMLARTAREAESFRLTGGTPPERARLLQDLLA